MAEEVADAGQVLKLKPVSNLYDVDPLRNASPWEC